MPLFSSDRERRLWAWTLAAIAAIYSTLFLASTLASLLGNHTFSTLGFLAGLIVVGVTILTHGLKTRPRGLEIGVALGIAVVYFLFFLRLTMPERSHIIEYSVVAAFTYEALTERASHGRFVPVPAILAILATSLIGVIDECIQLVIPNRVFDLQDMLFNFLAALMAVGAIVILRWARRWVESRAK